MAGWNQHPTPFVWNGKRRRRRERAKIRRLGGSRAALAYGSSIAGRPTSTQEPKSFGGIMGLTGSRRTAIWEAPNRRHWN
ncbi:MAG TPA: hypothetical protein VH593_00715 [Ktedonobacteraceae bacterium]